MHEVSSPQTQLIAVKSADTCRMEVNIVQLAALVCEYLTVN
jgi:hypothetical protein